MAADLGKQRRNSSDLVMLKKSDRFTDELNSREEKSVEKIEENKQEHLKQPEHRYENGSVFPSIANKHNSNIMIQQLDEVDEQKESKPSKEQESHHTKLETIEASELVKKKSSSQE